MKLFKCITKLFKKMENLEDKQKEAWLSKQLNFGEIELDCKGSDFDIDKLNNKKPMKALNKQVNKALLPLHSGEVNFNHSKYSKDGFKFYPKETKTGKLEWWFTHYGGSRIVGGSTEGYSKLYGETSCIDNAIRCGFKPLVHRFKIETKIRK